MVEVILEMLLGSPLDSSFAPGKGSLFCCYGPLWKTLFHKACPFISFGDAAGIGAIACIFNPCPYPLDIIPGGGGGIPSGGCGNPWGMNAFEKVGWMGGWISGGADPEKLEYRSSSSFGMLHRLKIESGLSLMNILTPEY